MRRILPAVMSQLLLFTLFSTVCVPQPVSTHHKQGSGHAFLTLRSTDGKVLAVGEALIVSHGTSVVSRLTFNFRDGSLDDDITVFKQNGCLHLLSDHHIQKGPSFPHPVDILVDVSKAQVTLHSPETGKDTSEHMEMPSDLANGLLPQVLQNIDPAAEQTKVSYVAPGSRPRIVELDITPDGDDIFTIAGTHHRAHRLKINVELGGMAGLVAPILGKEPKASYVWVTVGKVPVFLRLQAQFYEGGPIWNVEQASPVWPSSIER